MRVVLEKGFGGTRIKDVSDALGVSTGLVHYHFASKDELLAETMRYAADADIRRLEKTVAAGSDPVERLDRVLREYLPGPRDQSWTLWIDAWGEALRNPTLREISEELDQAWIELLERVDPRRRDREGFRTTDPAGVGVAVGRADGRSRSAGRAAQGNDEPGADARAHPIGRRGRARVATRRLPAAAVGGLHGRSPGRGAAASAET